MTSNDVSTIETITYLSNCSSSTKNNRFSHLEMLQQQQQFHVPTSSPSSCEHECNCMHHHHHHYNGGNGGGSSSNFSSTNVTNGPYAHHHNHFNHLNQHMHSNTTNSSYISQQRQHQHHQDGNLIYNNSTSSECNQGTNDGGSQSGCTSSVIHYIPSSNLSTLNIIPSCECVVGHIKVSKKYINSEILKNFFFSKIS